MSCSTTRGQLEVTLLPRTIAAGADVAAAAVKAMVQSGALGSNSADAPGGLGFDGVGASFGGEADLRGGGLSLLR